MFRITFSLYIMIAAYSLAHAQMTPEVDAVDDFYQVMGYPTSVFYPLENDSYPSDSTITLSILGSVDCADVMWNDMTNELTVTFTELTQCAFNYSLCDDSGNCDVAQVILQYSCYPWDYPLDMIDVLIDEADEYSFSLMNPCSDEAVVLLDFIPDSIDYVLNGTEITFTGNYMGEESFSYFISETDIFGCIICGTYYEYTLNFDIQNNIDENELVEIKVYPNPSKNYIKLESSSHIKEVYLINVLGHQILLKEIAQNYYELPELATGNYLVSIQMEGESIVRSLIID